MWKWKLIKSQQAPLLGLDPWSFRVRGKPMNRWTTLPTIFPTNVFFKENWYYTGINASVTAPKYCFYLSCNLKKCTLCVCLIFQKLYQNMHEMCTFCYFSVKKRVNNEPVYLSFVCLFVLFVFCFDFDVIFALTVIKYI